MSVQDKTPGAPCSKIEECARIWEDFCIQTRFISVTKVVFFHGEGNRRRYTIRKWTKIKIIWHFNLKFRKSKLMAYLLSICFRLCMGWFVVGCLHLFSSSLRIHMYPPGMENKFYIFLTFNCSLEQFWIWTFETLYMHFIMTCSPQYLVWFFLCKYT